MCLEKPLTFKNFGFFFLNKRDFVENVHSSRKNPKHFLFPDRDNSLLFSVLFGWKWKTCVFWSVIHIILQEFSPFSDRQIKQQQKIIWYSQLFFFGWTTEGQTKQHV